MSSRQFDLMPFSKIVEKTAGVKIRRPHFVVSFGCMIGETSEHDRYVWYNEAVGVSADMVRRYNRRQSYSLVISGDNNLYRNVSRAAVFAGVFGFEVETVNRHISRSTTQDSEWDADLNLGKTEERLVSFPSVFEQDISLRANKRRGAVYAAQFECFIEVISVSVDSMLLRISLGPGDTLIVNTENCTATLNGVNVLKNWSGDWLEISNKTMQLSLDSSTGGDLAGIVVFSEEYV